MAVQRILITGAAGNVGRLLRPLLARPDRVLRLLDLAAIPDLTDSEEAVIASVTDLPALRAAMRGTDAVLHLGGISVEDTWEKILDVNVNGTRTVLEAARLEGVGQLVLASSNHAVGFRSRDEGVIPGDAAPRPDTYYGVSKAALESLGSLYHDRFGMDVVCLRIGSCFERPRNARMLSTWLSPADAARLVEASLTARGFHIVWGVSANTRRWWSLAEDAAIGFHPKDDSEVFAGDFPEPDLKDAEHHLLGGMFCGVPLGEPMG